MKSLKNWMAAVLSLVMAVSLCVSPLCAPAVSAEDSVEDMQGQKDTLAAEAERLEGLRSQTAQTLEEKQQQEELLRQQISVKEQEIAVTQSMIAALDGKIADNIEEITAQEQAIAEQEASISDRFEQLRQRLRALSKSGNLSSLQLVMNISDYTDYLLRSKVVQLISENDQALMDEMEREISVIDAQKAQVETAKQQRLEERAPITALENDLAGQKAELVVLQSEVNIVVNELNDTVEGYSQSIEQLEAQQASLQNKIDDVLAQVLAEAEAKRAAEEEARRQAEEERKASEDSDDPDDSDDSDDSDDPVDPVDPPFVSGSMYWPVPDGRVITSSYKYRWGRWHKGVDIACYGDAEGLAIVAAADGTVVYTCTDGYGDGYGNYMIIDHGYDDAGQRIMTLYAHCSAVYAYEGQTVSAGDTIGAVGNTGNSDGAHLHFEVRVDGSAVNPMDGYLSSGGIDILG